MNIPCTVLKHYKNLADIIGAVEVINKLKSKGLNFRNLVTKGLDTQDGYVVYGSFVVVLCKYCSDVIMILGNWLYGFWLI